jgi:hypothetical protein
MCAIDSSYEMLHEKQEVLIVKWLKKIQIIYI